MLYKPCYNGVPLYLFSDQYSARCEGDQPTIPGRHEASKDTNRGATSALACLVRRQTGWQAVSLLAPGVCLDLATLPPVATPTIYNTTPMFYVRYIQTNIYNKVLNSISNAFLIIYIQKQNTKQYFKWFLFLLTTINPNHNSPHHMQCQLESPCCLPYCTVSSEVLCFTYPRMCFT